MQPTSGTTNFDLAKMMETLEGLTKETKALRALSCAQGQQLTQQAQLIKTQDAKIQEQANKILMLEQASRFLTERLDQAEMGLNGLDDRISLVSNKSNENYDELVTTNTTLSDGLLAEETTNSEFQQFAMDLIDRMVGRIKELESRLGIVSEDQEEEEKVASEFVSPKFNPVPVSLGGLSNGILRNNFAKELSPAALQRSSLELVVRHRRDVEDGKPEANKRHKVAGRKDSPLSPTVTETIYNEAASKSSSEDDTF